LLSAGLDEGLTSKEPKPIADIAKRKQRWSHTTQKMKRPLQLPLSLLTLSLTFLAKLTTLATAKKGLEFQYDIFEHIGHDHYQNFQCDDWIQAAFDADVDNSGGLNYDGEFTGFVLEIGIRYDDNEEGGNSWMNYYNNDTLPESFADVFEKLACECHDIFGMEASCCEEPKEEGLINNDDDSDFDDDDTTHMLGPGFSVGKFSPILAEQVTAKLAKKKKTVEVLLTGLANTLSKEDGQQQQLEEGPTDRELKYRHEFCKELYRGMEKEGLDVRVKTLEEVPSEYLPENSGPGAMDFSTSSSVMATTSVPGSAVSTTTITTKSSDASSTDANVVEPPTSTESPEFATTVTATVDATSTVSAATSATSTKDESTTAATPSISITSANDSVNAPTEPSQTTESATTATISETTTLMSTTATFKTESDEATTVASTTSATAAVTVTPTSVINQYEFTFIGSTTKQYLAKDILDQTDDNSAMDDIIRAFWKVTVEILEDYQGLNEHMDVLMDPDFIGDGREDGEDVEDEVTQDLAMEGSRRNLQQSALDEDFIGEEASFLFDRVFVDVGDVGCPTEIAYAKSNSCLEFTVSLAPLQEGPLTPTLLQTYITDFLSATNTEGRLYDAIIAINPDTEIAGLGSPGKGIPKSDSDSDLNTQSNLVELEQESDPAPSSLNEVVLLGEEEKEVQTSGFGVGGIVGLVVAVVVVAAVIVVSAIQRRKRNENRRVEEFAGDEAIVDDDMDARSVSRDVIAMEAGEGNLMMEGRGRAAEALHGVEVDCERPGSHHHRGEDEDDSKSHSSSIVSTEEEEHDGNMEIILSNMGVEKEEQSVTVGSTLAAMGVASTVTTRLSANKRSL